MSFLTPLGFLGFLGVLALIIIYIIKPNFQNKIISSTFIWKLSLKYKKKRIPISKLRNIILCICQVLILSAAALVITQPMFNTSDVTDGSDEIIIIDASASMHSTQNEETRLDRALNAALADANKALDSGKNVTVILAAEKASYLVQQAGKDQAQLVYDAFDALTNFPEEYYTYGSPDIDGAMLLAEEITAYTEKVNVTLYTDTTYLNEGKIKVHNVTDSSEWNAAILDVRATVVENYLRSTLQATALTPVSAYSARSSTLTPAVSVWSLKLTFIATTMRL